MKGYPVALPSAASKSVMQKEKVMAATKPIAPFRVTVVTIVRGTTFEASRISSAEILLVISSDWEREMLLLTHMCNTVGTKERKESGKVTNCASSGSIEPSTTI